MREVPFLFQLGQVNKIRILLDPARSRMLAIQHQTLATLCDDSRLSRASWSIRFDGNLRHADNIASFG